MVYPDVTIESQLQCPIPKHHGYIAVSTFLNCKLTGLISNPGKTEYCRVGVSIENHLGALYLRNEIYVCKLNYLFMYVFTEFKSNEFAFCTSLSLKKEGAGGGGGGAMLRRKSGGHDYCPFIWQKKPFVSNAPSRLTAGGRLTSWLFTKRGRVESGTTKQWQGGGYEPVTSGLQTQRPNH